MDAANITHGKIIVYGRVVSSDSPIHNILSTAPQLNISQKAQGTLPEDGNVMPYIINKLNE
jgi:hypothetical protein